MGGSVVSALLGTIMSYVQEFDRHYICHVCNTEFFNAIDPPFLSISTIEKISASKSTKMAQEIAARDAVIRDLRHQLAEASQSSKKKDKKS